MINPIVFGLFSLLSELLVSEAVDKFSPITFSVDGSQPVVLVEVVGGTRTDAHTGVRRESGIKNHLQAN